MKFKVTGIFYNQKGYKFRKVLNIRRKDTNLSKPELLVVMMNPGNSRPVDDSFNENKEVLALPDKTQYRIMEVMLNCGIDYARILNLSDIRETKSSKLLDLLSELDSKNINHSIFDESRKTDFDNYYEDGIKTIFAWGVDDRLNPLAVAAIKRIGLKNSFGINKKGKEFAFYHPLPQNYIKQKEWVELITKQLTQHPK